MHTLLNVTKRLINITSSIRFRGYDRTLGDVVVQILKRGNDYIYRVVHGHHRAAALAALGYSLLPCIPRMLVDIALIDEWPQVRSGIWERKQALEYFNHHFDFKSQEWARNMGLFQTHAAIRRYKKLDG